ncbi:hypothetical protein D082_33860 [Synechocystis sp. PCC 6714]|nr:hypothetical protein D082_33860 [Synechocystis sp. PCC 6714]
MEKLAAFFNFLLNMVNQSKIETAKLFTKDGFGSGQCLTLN